MKRSKSSYLVKDCHCAYGHGLVNQKYACKSDMVLVYQECVRRTGNFVNQDYDLVNHDYRLANRDNENVDVRCNYIWHSVLIRFVVHPRLM